MKQRPIYLLMSILVSWYAGTTAQEHHHMNGMRAGEDSSQSDSPSMSSMSMEGSGTSWLPASSPVYGSMIHSGEWMFMTHGAATLRFTHQGGPRGNQALSMPNWFMGMAQRPVGENGQLKFRTMLSLDRLVDGGDGYPLLLQTGETWRGEHLVDRQHPHDLFAELSATYTHAFSQTLSGFVYLGYPGEPALGPPAFMHRTSTMYNPDAPVSHHWQDATHISFGVATAGVSLDNTVKLEGSIFTGREPDENRYNLDKPRFDSYSGRVSFNPANTLALQASYGKITDPEGHGFDAYRSTASVLHSTSLNENFLLSSSVVWGQNNDAHAGLMHSLLFESLLDIQHNAMYIRYEYVQKARGELGIEDDHHRKERLHLFTVGANQSVYANTDINLRLGIQGTFYGLPSDLSRFYGKNPASFQVYLTLTPARLLVHG